MFSQKVVTPSELDVLRLFAISSFLNTASKLFGWVAIKMINELLLQTDQTGCYDESGRVIDCLDTGQDAAAKKAHLREAPDRFRVRDDVVQDQWTGLLWHIHANLGEFPFTWEEALALIQQMNASRLSGENSWRLPSRKELFSLLSYQHINPVLPKGHPFKHIFNGYYWTRTECARLKDQAWYVHLGGGKVYRGMKYGSYMVWPVSGQFEDYPCMKNRFNITGNSCYDRFTGRYWYRNQLNNRATTWKDAIRAIERLNEASGTDHTPWRLPNIRELESLIDDRNHSPTFADGFWLDQVQEGYWSSTTSLSEPRYAWVLYARDGAIGVGFKSNEDFDFLAVHR